MKFQSSPKMSIVGGSGGGAGPFATLLRLHHHRRTASDSTSNSSNPNSFSGSTLDAKGSGLVVLNKDKTDMEGGGDLRSRYAQQKKDAKEIWIKTQPLIRNDWQWPNPPTSDRQIDASKNYAERVLTLPDETVEDLTTRTGLKRKRDVRAETLDEMEWNDGVRTFEQRRKAWTNAVDVFLPAGNETDHERVQLMKNNAAEMLRAVEKDLDGNSDDSSTDDMDTGMDDGLTSLDPVKSDFGTTLLPYYMPILPATLTLTQPLPNETAEKTMYKNLVTEGKVAIAPIPLANVVRACVAGLKEADEWPPKSGMMDALPGNGINKEKRRSKIRSLFGLKKDGEMMSRMYENGSLAGDAGFDTSSR